MRLQSRKNNGMAANTAKHGKVHFEIMRIQMRNSFEINVKIFVFNGAKFKFPSLWNDVILWPSVVSTTHYKIESVNIGSINTKLYWAHMQLLCQDFFHVWFLIEII